MCGGAALELMSVAAFILFHIYVCGWLYTFHHQHLGFDHHLFKPNYNLICIRGSGQAPIVNGQLYNRF